MTEYVVYHKTCGHIAGICNDRDLAMAQQSRGWRLRLVNGSVDTGDTDGQ